MTIDMNQLRNAPLRDAMRLTDHALQVVSLGAIFLEEECLAAAKYLDEQATTTADDAEKAILHAIATYYRTQGSN